MDIFNTFIAGRGLAWVTWQTALTGAKFQLDGSFWKEEAESPGFRLLNSFIKKDKSGKKWAY
jgi:hypothetical protein